jgi:hypothetical protein
VIVTTDEVTVKIGADTIIVPRTVHDASQNAKKSRPSATLSFVMVAMVAVPMPFVEVVPRRLPIVAPIAVRVWIAQTQVLTIGVWIVLRAAAGICDDGLRGRRAPDRDGDYGSGDNQWVLHLDLPGSVAAPKMVTHIIDTNRCSLRLFQA